MSLAFDDYWNSDLARSVSDMVDEPQPVALEDLIERELAAFAATSDLLKSYPVDSQDWQTRFVELANSWVTGTATYLQDEAVPTGVESQRLVDMIEAVAPPSQEELTVFSPYLIPDQEFLDALREMADRSVWVRVVTGTKAAVNHTAAYAHYEKYVGAILDTGAELYEIDATPSDEVVAAVDVPPVANERIAIHLKGIVSDRRHSFIGSLNFDPRAVVINTENGLHVDSLELGEQLAGWFDQLLSPENAWQVTRDSTGKLWWEGKGERRPGSPHRGNLQRIMARFFRILPIESQL